MKKNIVEKLIESYRESNHYKHFWCGMAVAICMTILATLGAAFACEYKDKAWGGTFDWSDIAWTLMGGVIGQMVQIIIILTVINL